MVEDTETQRDPLRKNLGSEFRKLWAATAISNLGDGVALRAAPLLAASLTRDPGLVAGLSVAQRLPWLLFPLLSGALVDRLDRRRAMAAAAAVRGALIGLLGIAVLLEQASLPLLYAVFFLLSTGETVFDVAAAALLPAVVPRETLPKSNARLAGTLTVTNQFVGPPLGGFLFATAAALPFLLGAGGLAAAAALIMALRGTFTVPRRARVEGAVRTSLRAEVAEGIRWLWRHPLLRTISLAMAILNLTLVAQVSVMVLFAQERLGLGPTGYGILVSMYGIGGVLGGLVAHLVIARLGASRTLRAAMVVEAATPAVLALLTNPLLAGTVLCFFGTHAAVWGALLRSLRQELTPARLRGRVESAYWLLTDGTAAPGAVLGGILAAGIGLTAPFWLGAAIGALLIPLVWSTFSEATVARVRADIGDDCAVEQ